jgi:hypothetical protein
MSTIEQKKNEINNNTEQQNNWVNFGVNVVYNFILTLCIGILGANFIFLSSSSNAFLETIIPKNSDSYFTGKIPSAAVATEDARNNGGGEKYTGNKDNNCNRAIRNGSTIDFTLFDFKRTGTWPYTLRDPNVGSINFIQKFINWVIETIYGAYSINRDFLQSWLSIFSKKNPGFISNDVFIMLIIAPLTLIASPLVLPFGFFSSLFSSFFIGYTKNNNDISKNGWIWAIIGLFLGYTWILTSAISIAQFLQYIIFLTLLPLLKNFSKVKNILHCNVTSLGLLFGTLVCGSAFTHLDNITASVMLVVFILTTIKTLW